MQEDKYLPIGTIVTLKGGKKKIMINGYCQEHDKQIFDYRGCLFPEGVLETTGVSLFNHEDIQTIHHLGFKNEESLNLSNKLNLIMNK